MARLSSLLSVLLTIWFLSFDQQITGFLTKPYDNSSNVDFLLSNDTTLAENSTEILSEVERSGSSNDDIIEVNVSGQKISTFRSTLTAVPNSKLALMFQKHKQGTVFFDYNPVQFNYLLDQLRTIKRSPEIPAYELDIRAPYGDIRTNFSYMIFDLGLSPDRFLFPLAGAHLNLNRNSLIGWQECYRSTYDTPFNLLTMMMTCKSRRLLVACHPTGNKENLTVAGVGKWHDILRECSSINNCPADLKNNTSFYYVKDQAWGFEGRPENPVSTYNGYNHYKSRFHESSYSNPCDASDQYSEYRLCWSFRSSYSRGGGDRCGGMKNLHNAADWERIIYQAV